MGVLTVVTSWDAALRAGDWSAARDALADDATYVGIGEEETEETPTCTNADEIVALMAPSRARCPTSRSSASMNGPST